MELDRQALDRWITTEPESTLDAIADELVDDGDTWELEDGRMLRLRIVPDEGMNPFDEYEIYGKVVPVEYNRSRERANRPDGFDGNAEKLWPPQNGDQIWWQPPPDIKRTDPGFNKLREMVMDLAAFGMCAFMLELCDGTDAYGRSIVVNVASLGGVEPFPTDEYKREIVSELLSEVMGEQ